MIVRVGRWCFRHRSATVMVWLAVLVAASALGSTLIGSAFSSKFEIPASESATGFKVLERTFPSSGAMARSGSIVFRAESGVKDAAVQTVMEQMFDRVSALPGVRVVSPYDPAGLMQVDVSGTIAYASVNVASDLDQRQVQQLGSRISSLRPAREGLTVEVGGQAFAEFEPPESELLGLGFAVLVLIVAFGSVLAMGLPIAVALAGVGTGAGVVALVSHLTTVPDFTTSLGAMIGLAVGIDYALFIVTRYREHLRHGMGCEEAVVSAMDTAGRAVVFAGLTVVVSLLGMLLIGIGFVSGMGIGAALTVAVTMVAALSLLPALLSFAGGKVERTSWRGIIAAGLVAVALFGAGLSIEPLLVAAPLAVVVFVAGFAFAPLRQLLPARPEKQPRQTLAWRWSRVVQRRPWQALLLGSLALLAMAFPVLSLRMGFADEGNFAPETTTRRAYDMLSDGFGPGFNGPLVLVATFDESFDKAALESLSQALRADPGVAFVAPPRFDSEKDPSAVLLAVIPTTSPQDEVTAATVDRLRSSVIPRAFSVPGSATYLTGATAASIDFTRFLADRLWVFIFAVLVVSFLLLMMVFRSLLVPVKAVVMNILSIAAAYGVVVAVFQWGWLSSVTGVEPAPIEPFAPMMMFAIVFGLSMDYEVFLLSRVREEFDRTFDAHGSVANGLAATARVITAAALIMIVVFGAFLLEDNRVIKLFGTGLAAAVALDATLVRMLLVPATMELLGARNWWLPRWLDRVLPRLNVEGSSHDVHRSVPAVSAGSSGA